MLKNTYLALAFMFGSIIASAQFDEALIRKGDSVADLYKGHELSDFRALSLKLTKDLTNDVSKARAIFRWICTNIQNDNKYFKQSKRSKAKLGVDSPEYLTWSRRKFQEVMDRLVRKKKTICNGYSFLFRELAFHAGLQSSAINGYSRTSKVNIGQNKAVPNHSWNAVLIDDHWFFIDATWGSGFTDAYGAFQFRFNPTHFCTPNKLFAQTHFPLDSNWIIFEGAPSLETYISQPLVFSTSTKFGLVPNSPNQYETTISKNELITFQATLKESEFTIPPIIKVALGSEYRKILTVKQESTKGHIELMADWSPHITGTYIIDLMLNGVVSCRWKVKVERPSTGQL